MFDTPIIYKISNIIIENKSVKTFWIEPFDNRIKQTKPKPGQYVMLWLPFLAEEKNQNINNTIKIKDQIPMSISDWKNNKIALTIKNLGPTTNELHKYEIGRKIGIIGPLGKPFKIKGNKILVVAGGIGIVPLHYLIKSMHNKKIKIDLLFGVKTKDELFFIKKLKPYCSSLNITADDGSCGCKGIITDLLPKIYDGHNHIFSCGPEKMMKCVLDFSLKNKIPAQFSLERYMHCGIGVCGFCSLDGLLVCKDGPVFNSVKLKNIKEFGIVRRNNAGCKDYL